MMETMVTRASLATGRRVTMRPGVDRVTLAYNSQNMLCYFYLEKAAEIPLHSHPPVQNGFVVKGRLRFLKGNGESFEAGPGDGYFFDANEVHGLEVLEAAEIIECFSPMRPEYV